MTLRNLYALALPILVWSLFGCSGKTNFRAISQKSETTKNSSSAKDCDFSQDQVNLHFPAEIQNCIDKGKIWNFGKDAADGCSNIENAKTFECSYAGITKRADQDLDLGIGPDLAELQAEGTKLIGCGEVSGRELILVQGWRMEAGSDQSCVYNPATMKIFVNCYQLFEQGEKPEGWDQLSVEERVERCFDNDYDLP